MKYLKHLSDSVASELYDNVEVNLERYRSGSFTDLTWAPGWSIELTLQVDLEPLVKLDFSAGIETDIANSLLVWDVLGKLPPALACENRIWTRLTHVECLEYSRARWIEGVSEDKLPESIRKHFFADTQTRYRDDNAISRLWWNAYIANLVYPGDFEKALRQILKTADVRSNFIERPWITSRPKLAKAIITAMLEDSWVTVKEQNYRDFMKNINRYGGGVLFETMNDNEISEFVAACSRRAQEASA